MDPGAVIDTAAQWTVEQFYNSLNELDQAAKAEQQRMETNKIALTEAYTATKSIDDPEQRAALQEFLKPVIHQNSVVRMRYRTLVENFNKALSLAGNMLRTAGFQVPSELSGMGQAVIIVPAVVLGALGVAWATFAAFKVANEANTNAVNAAIESAQSVLANPGAYSVDDVKQARQALLELPGMTPKPAAPDMFGALIPIAAVVALVILGPPLIRALSPRGR